MLTKEPSIDTNRSSNRGKKESRQICHSEGVTISTPLIVKKIEEALGEGNEEDKIADTAIDTTNMNSRHMCFLKGVQIQIAQ
eukprot:1273703-Ditylum_brightwellii.AAC.1